MTQPLGKLQLLIGPVGAGKSSYAQKVAARGDAVFLDVDSWMVRMFGADTRPQHDVLGWYLERRDRCRALVWDVALEVLRCRVDVLLELGLVEASEREHYYVKARDEGLPLSVYLLDAPRAVRRERVLKRNESAGPTTQVVPLVHFELASDAWQAPTEAERVTWGLIDV